MNENHTIREKLLMVLGIILLITAAISFIVDWITSRSPGLILFDVLIVILAIYMLVVSRYFRL